MSLRSAILLGSLASCLLLSAGAPARADYTYSVSSGGSVPFGTGSNLVLTGQPTSQALTNNTLINIQDLAITTTASPASTDSATVPFSFTITLNSMNGPNQAASDGTGTSNVTGTLMISRSDTGGEISQLTSLTLPSIVIGTSTYTLDAAAYAGPTVNSAPNSVGAGNITVFIDPVGDSAVPEPASLVMLGTGAAVVMGLGLRRIRKA